ncbi:MAG: undecaprenyl-diphosphate phosphatase [Candidatus Aenigmarchaeota archaeon]|nr:undecaprenyl-diphosphate phosphatase [Candidatus Aenigmarchaeota archaeon]
MQFIEAFVLAVVQGLTEWLPVSSEGVSSLVMINFFGRSLNEAIYLSVWLHTGTLLAATLYFRKDMACMLRNLPAYIRNPNDKEDYSGLTRFLLVSTFTTAVIAAPLVVFFVDALNFSGGAAMAFIGALLIITGLLQMLTKAGSVVSDSPRFSDALFSGAAQAFSVFPGLSRSGLTVSALLLRKHDPEYALKLSFLMSIPAVFVAEVGLAATGRIFIFDSFALLAVLISFAVGFLTLGSLLRIAQKINFGYFCIFLGALSLLAVLI